MCVDFILEIPVTVYGIMVQEGYGVFNCLSCMDNTAWRFYPGVAFLTFFFGHSFMFTDILTSCG
jgi:hypothetical protein